MAKRAREILLRWGSFSLSFVSLTWRRAELLCDIESDRDIKGKKSWVISALLVGVISPMIAVIPFMFALEENGKDPSKDEIALAVSSLWLGFVR